MFTEDRKMATENLSHANTGRKEKTVYLWSRVRNECLLSEAKMAMSKRILLALCYLDLKVDALEM